MSQTKYKMPNNVRSAVICHCKGYEDSKCWYLETMASIDHVGGIVDGLPKGNGINSTTESRAVTRADIETSIRVQIMRAIEQAKLRIGEDLQNSKLRHKLQEAIWESTLDARSYPYEVWDLPAITRNNFYERKRKFLMSIALQLGIL